MKVLAIATILIAAVSAAPTKELCPSPIPPIPSYGLPSPPLNGGNPPVNGVIPPVNSVIPPVNGVIPPVNVANPPVNDVIPPVNVATPVSGNNVFGQYECPSGLYSNPQCCSTDVLGIADLDCSSPSKTPKDGADFKAICAAAGGKTPKCCVVPILGQGLLCQDVIGNI